MARPRRGFGSYSVPTLITRLESWDMQVVACLILLPVVPLARRISTLTFANDASAGSLSGSSVPYGHAVLYAASKAGS